MPLAASWLPSAIRVQLLRQIADLLRFSTIPPD
jgi:hypothetical protein